MASLAMRVSCAHSRPARAGSGAIIRPSSTNCTCGLTATNTRLFYESILSSRTKTSLSSPQPNSLLSPFFSPRLHVSGASPRRLQRVAAGPSGRDGEEEKKKEEGKNSEGKGMRESGEGGGEEVVEEALHLDAGIPPTAHEFLQKVSSKAYDIRSRLEQTLDTGGYDVVDANPWGREEEKPLYVLAQKEDQLYTMPTRRARSEVEHELQILFQRKTGRSRLQAPERRPMARSEREGPKFRMHVEDVREGLLVSYSQERLVADKKQEVFEDEDAAAQYCSVLEGHGKQCVGVAQVPASEVFAICQKSNALAILFRRGITPPRPDRLQMNLKARKRSLEE